VNRPLLIFDGDCGFCRGWIARWKQITRDRLDYAPFQEVADRFPEITQAEFQTSVHFIDTQGRHTRAAEAVCRLLAVGDRQWPLWMYEHVPGARPFLEFLYRRIASHRTFFGYLTRWVWGAPPLQSTYQQTRALFLRGLALVYFLAFTSLIPQIAGLIGTDGILPAARFLEQAQSLGMQRFFLLPTLAWFSASTHVLQGFCIGGGLAALLAFLGFMPGFLFVVQWTLYVSVVTVGGDFLSFQWDALLLETGLMAIFFAPWRFTLRAAASDPASRPILWLLRWLLFRLMLQSAWVKWFSGDPLWHHLTALTVHFETQPLPNIIAWWAHHLPVAILKILCAGLFYIEGVVPFFIFAPRRARFAACGLLILLQSLIALSGNYCFFNVLTLVLCVTLLDDQLLRSVAPSFGDREKKNVFKSGVAFSLFLLSCMFWGFQMGWRPPAPIRRVAQAVYPFRSVNDYGLFAVMTPTRPEIEIEGSADGKTWKVYEFKYKPQALNRRPMQVAPYQPRLDWQMWFAALSDYQHTPWFLSFCLRLLQGSEPVLSLLKANPFPGNPPRYIRAMIYEYHFTSLEEHRLTGQWWKRQYKGEYLPSISLRR